MHNAADDGIEIEPGDRNDAYRSVVSDLVALIEHVQASLKLIEQRDRPGSIARQPGGMRQTSSCSMTSRPAT